MKEKNTYFVFSDVHGEYNALKEGLQAAGYDSNNPKHILISCGDNFDRGPDSQKIYSFLSSHKGIYVKGNHDVMFEEFLDKGMDGEFVLFNILHNGLGATVASFGSLKESYLTPSVVDEVARRYRGSSVHNFVKYMPLYFETQNYVFCHAGINPMVRDWKDTDEHFMLWDIEYSHRSVPNINNKTVVIGHHHAFRVKENAHDTPDYNNWERDDNRYARIDVAEPQCVKVYGNNDEHSPYFNGNKIAIDGCVNLTKKVNVLVIEDYPLEEPKKGEQESVKKAEVEQTAVESTFIGDEFNTHIHAHWADINTAMGRAWVRL